MVENNSTRLVSSDSTCATHVIPVEDDNGWKTVPPKHTCSPTSISFSNDSPTPLNTFKNLAQVNEIYAKGEKGPTMSKSQQKKRKKALGKPSIQSS